MGTENLKRGGFGVSNTNVKLENDKKHYILITLSCIVESLWNKISYDTFVQANFDFWCRLYRIYRYYSSTVKTKAKATLVARLVPTLCLPIPVKIDNGRQHKIITTKIQNIKIVLKTNRRVASLSATSRDATGMSPWDVSLAGNY